MQAQALQTVRLLQAHPCSLLECICPVRTSAVRAELAQTQHSLTQGLITPAQPVLSPGTKTYGIALGSCSCKEQDLAGRRRHTPSRQTAYHILPQRNHWANTSTALPRAGTDQEQMKDCLKREEKKESGESWGNPSSFVWN